MYLLDPAAHGSRPALIDAASGACLTHAELAEQVRACAAALVPGTRALVFCYCDTGVPSVLAYLSAVEAGHAVVLLEATLPAPRRAELEAVYRPELVVTGAPWPDAGELDEIAVPGAAFLARRMSGPRAPIFEDLTVLLSTSGTTGSPKLVRLSRASVHANADSIRKSLAIGPDERAVASLPFHYSYGLSVLNSHLLAGAALVITPQSVLESGFWQAAAQHGATSFAGVPYTYELLTRIGIEKRLPATVRTMTQAGGRLPVPLVQRFHALMDGRGGRFFVMYGQTEATARIACLPSDMVQAKLGAAGRAIPGGRLTIEGEGGALPPGATGEVVYRGPNVMLGYATCREDLARGDDLGGVLRTGDVGYLDPDGFLYLTGRTKRIAKLFGLRVSLDELEDRLRPRGPVAAVAAGERVRLFFEGGTPEDVEAALAELSKDLRVHRSAFEGRRLEALPLNANGKVDYLALERLP